jgi:hypothetical protein
MQSLLRSQRPSARAYVAAFVSYLLLVGQVAPLYAAAGRPTTPSRNSDAGLSAPAAPPSNAAPRPAPLLFAAPNVVATKVDAWDDTATPDGKAEPGQTVTYTVTISNTGDADATGVQFTDSVDTHTTLVPGSVNTQPIALPDTYNVIGNVRIQPNAAQGLLANDRDPDTGNNTGLTASGPTTSTQGGNVTINADGSFSYNPPAGFAGTDTFTYTITDGGGKTDTATATFNVGNGTSTPGTNVVWFVNTNAPPPGGDGRLTSPFNCYTGTSNGVQKCFSDTAAADPGDTIYIFAGPAAGGYTLLNNQKLVGQGASDTLANIAGLTVPTASDTLPPTGGASPTITTTIASTNAINLGQGNLLRGFTVSNTTGAKIAGSNFGTLTVGNNTTPDVTLSGAGQALNLSTGTFAATSAFSSVTTTSSTGQGINLAGIAGTIAFGSTTVSGSTTQGILVGTTTADINFGNTSVTGGTDGISLQNNSSGTRTFGTLGVSGGSGNAFLHAVGGGNVTAGGAANLASGNDPVEIANAANGTSINFAGGATVNKTTGGGEAVHWSGTNTGATLTFNTLALTTSNATGMNLSGGGTVNVTNAAGSSITTVAGTANPATAITASGVAFGMNFTTISHTGNGSTGLGINLTSITGSLTVNNGASTATDVENTGGMGITISTSSATFNFGNTTVNGSANTGVNLNTNTGAITFGQLNSSPDMGSRGLVATSNTGAITTTSGTVSSNQATAVTVQGASSASKTPLNMQLTAVNETNNGANGIFLKFTSATGNPGGFNVTGNGGTCTFASSGTCSGGNITATLGADNTTSGIGVYLEDVASVSLTRMRINGHSNGAIRGKTVAGFTLQTSVVDGSNGTSSTADNDIVVGEDAVRFTNLTGSALIDSCTIAGGNTNNLRVVNNTGTLDRLIVSNSFIGDPDAIGSGQRGLSATQGADDVNLQAEHGVTAMNVTLSGNTLNFARNRVVRFTNNDNTSPLGTLDAVVRGNTLVNANPTASQVAGGGVLTIQGLGNVTYEVACNKMANPLGIGVIISKSANTAGTPAGDFTGTIFDNTIGITGQSHSGGGAGASALSIEQQGTGTHTVLVKNNVIRRYGKAGILINTINNLNQLATMNATVIGNTVAEPDSDASAGLEAVPGADPANDSQQVSNYKIGGAGAERNDFTAGDPNDAHDVFFNGAAGTANLSKGVSASSSFSQIITDNNIAPVTSATTGTVNAVDTVPALPPAINETCTPPAAPVTFDGDTIGNPDGAAVQSDDATFASAPEADALSGPADTPAADGTLDTPRPENVQTEMPLAAPAAPAPATRPAPAARPLDSKKAKRDGGTTFRHTYKDSSAPLNLEPLAQRRKVRPPVLTSNPSVPEAPGGTVSINIGTLQPGDSVTITFQVVIENPYTSDRPYVSNQGRVTGSNFSTVNGVPTTQNNTDDPAVGGAADPTLTPVNATNIRINDARQAEPSTGTAQMLFTLTVLQPAPMGGLSVNYSTADGGANPATGGASCDGTVDYITASGTVNVPAGSQVATIPVTVCADNNAGESDETFLLNISGATAGTIQDAQATGTITPNTPGSFIISELRTSGPGGAGDDFVEFYNNTDSPLTVAASDASAGYGLYKMGAACSDTPVLIATIPNGTMIPARGHYLAVGSQYSLADYGGTGAASGDVTLTSDIGDDQNVAVFSTANVVNISSANRLDAVGGGSNTGAVCDLLREGTNLPATSGTAANYSFFRKECDFVGGVGCTAGGNPKDTNDNSADFLFADTQGTSISGVTQLLGAPGPENLTSPVRRDTSGVGLPLLDATVSSALQPNRFRDPSATGANATFGTLSIRRRVTNQTGGNVTRLRFRIVEITTFPSPSGGVADLRALTSVDEVGVSVNDAATCAASGAGPAPCMVTVRGTTLEQPPAQSNGGGYNATLSAGTVTLATPLANGASVNVRFVLGVQAAGTFRFYCIIDALP